MLAIAGTGYGLIGLLVIILLVVPIFYLVRRAKARRVWAPALAFFCPRPAEREFGGGD